jgi:hypothetical protein
MIFTVNGGQLYMETTVSEGMPLLMAFLEKSTSQGGSTPTKVLKVRRTGGGRPKGSKNRKPVLVSTADTMVPDEAVAA